MSRVFVARGQPGGESEVFCGTIGVILESEDLHRVAYNATFQHFNVQPKGTGDVADWSVEFYDKLQNSIGGGKPKMRWYFGNSLTLC